MIWASWQTPADAQIFTRLVVLESPAAEQATLNRLVYEGLLAALPWNMTLERRVVSSQEINNPAFWRSLDAYDWWINLLDEPWGDPSAHLNAKQQLIALYPLDSPARPLQTWTLSLSSEVWLKSALRQLMLGGQQMQIVKPESSQADALVDRLIPLSAELGLVDLEVADYAQLPQLQRAIKQLLQLDRADARCQALTRLLKDEGSLECQVSPRQDVQRLVYLGESKGLELLLSLLKLYAVSRPVDWLVLEKQPFTLHLPQDAAQWVTPYSLSANLRVSVNAQAIVQTQIDKPLSLWAASVIQLITRLDVNQPQYVWDLPLGFFEQQSGLFYPVPSLP